jgi:hypothetical protein
VTNIRKAQIQAYNAQAALVYDLSRAWADADGDRAACSKLSAQWAQANEILTGMEDAGYTPQRWGMGLAARWETGDETSAELERLNGADWD